MDGGKIFRSQLIWVAIRVRPTEAHFKTGSQFWITWYSKPKDAVTRYIAELYLITLGNKSIKCIRLMSVSSCALKHIPCWAWALWNQWIDREKSDQLRELSPSGGQALTGSALSCLPFLCSHPAPPLRTVYRQHFWIRVFLWQWLGQ